jgi:hypothetical protein
MNTRTFLLINALAASPVPPAMAQSAQLKPANITAPRFNEVLLEITPARLIEMRHRLADNRGEDPEQRNYNSEMKAHRDWVKCQARIRAELKPEGDRVEKQMNSNAEQMEKIAKEAADRLRNAKSPQEMQAIAAEMTKQQMTLAQPGTDLNKKGDDRMASECGVKPKKPTIPDRKQGGLAWYNMLDRVSMFCGFGTSIVGRDGSVGIDPEIFRDMAGTDDRLFVYSKSEAVVLRNACAELDPWLKAQGYGW